MPTGLPELDEMVDVLSRAPAVYRPSRFWEGVIAKHAATLTRDGLTTFKQTINNSYFQMDPRAYARALPRLLASLARRPSLDPLLVRTRHCGSPVARSDRLLAAAVGLFFWHLRGEVPSGLFDLVEEPQLGCPTTYRIGRHEVSQDLCHSVSELAYFSGEIPANARIAELGAGYGRLAYVVLKAMPGVTYHVVDIPPSLYLSQRYLTSVLPGLRTFTFREFSAFADVAEELGRAQLVFLEPQQLELLPDSYFDAFATISTLDEMTREQIAVYVSAIDRLCRGVFYMKQWRAAHNPFDDLTTREDAYPIPTRWRLLRRRATLVPPGMFERVYACRPGATPRSGAEVSAGRRGDAPSE